MIKKIIPNLINNIYSKIYGKFNQILYSSLTHKRVEEERLIPKYELHQKHIQNLKMLLNRKSLLDRLPKNAICAEIGVDKGDFTKMIVKQTLPKKLHLIDAWGDPSRYHNGLRDLVIKRFRNEIKQKVIELNVGYSTTVLKKFPNQYFDWVYLDTSHIYKITAGELAILKNKVKRSGIISGHDYSIGNWTGDCRYGVIEAVHELCVKDKWQLIYLTADFNESPSFAIRRI